jgi:hypothetical protein
MNDFLNNAWFISLTSILITFIATPWLYQASDWIRSRRGALTGTYLALSDNGDPSSLNAELIHCRHIGQKLKGSISGRALIRLDTDGGIISIRPIESTWEFVGRMPARQALINYWSEERTAQNGGTITMGLDANGRIFRGIWCGTATNEQVISGQCMWIRIANTISLNTDQVRLTVDGVLDSIANPWRDHPSVYAQKLRYILHARDSTDPPGPGQERDPGQSPEAGTTQAT